MESELFVESHSKPIITYDSITCYSILINYIVGTGVFGLPLAFRTSGLLLAILMSITFFVLCCITAFWMLESLARTCGLHSLTSEGRPITQITTIPSSVTKMGNIYFGVVGKRTVISVLSFFCIGALWAYSSIFSSTTTLLLWKYIFPKYGTCSANIGIWGWFDHCHITYIFSLLFYSMLVLPMSFMEIAEQAFVQKFLTMYRFAAIFLMIFTSFISLLYRSPSYSDDDIIDPLALFNLNGFGAAFSVISVSLACHHNIPESVAPLQDKRKLKKLIFITLLSATIIYITLGVIGALCFGKKTVSPITTNWLEYTGCDGGFGICQDHKIRWYGYVIQITILMFPLVNLTSEYPLVSATLASNISQLSSENTSKVSFSSKCLAAFPPLLLAMIKADLSKIFGFTGIFGFVLILILPSMFQIFSKKTYKLQFGKKASTTIYSGVYSTSKLAWCVLIISIILFAFSVVQNLDSLFNINWLN
ncbi:amino acid transporter, putative [Entamoeba histolytica HM-1:IMSS-B]|uniref:Amino acid transporter, putative n=5 Tax=Entamoeba histolytica TaxID=5759 RepID=C4M1Z1_ENTH1|nr:amino acid transporter, putative [Entamoeba histolytica HM-1:IMSS]EMD49112.1 amino acid transporter, putative [Entamoeba histolytica KU27]EMH77281.1 amino acid transporter, putative [Entamoeba histolytica HM-1:IMSS-B]ENY62550.1 amino acid transporter, putative [Entamoeba histolytica HM-1:IMSS-A]GAT95264.1 amino acid transporter putative [Entamoeba histolytica]EAL46834.1 amino acid transporter, putative [Entamoeba histolytica HM-1:IMSS]|eukprot:XP_652220.1 amino acid transporter, putative [Entamoeba histolytica HM-1:IMSS]